MRKHYYLLALSAIYLMPVSFSAYADIVPSGNQNNAFYYKIGGGSDLALPPVNSTNDINLNANADLSMGNSCEAFNPALSIANTFNDLKDQAENIEQGVLSNATGSLAQMPMYLLAQADPTAYNMINNALLDAKNKIALSVKSCEQTKSEIAQGKNPYQDWATLSVNDQWKKNLSLTSTGQEDINDASKDVTENAGETGVPWVQGKSSGQNGFYAGGKDQPPVQVIADTVTAGYNAMLNRDLNNPAPAPAGGDLALQFPTPKNASDWIKNVVGDQTITTCNDPDCIAKQGGISGRGLLPWITTCNTNSTDKNQCASNIAANLSQLVNGSQESITKNNLEAVSASGIVISPEVIAAIRNMDATQQNIVINKLSQEIATQHVIDRALLARNILQTGSEVPVIASNEPAQKIIAKAIDNLDKDIQSIAFESQVRKQMMTNTVSEILTYQSQQQNAAMNMPKITPNTPLLQNGALPSNNNKNNLQNKNGSKN